MLDKTEMMRTFRALEMLYKGQDISAACACLYHINYKLSDKAPYVRH